MPNLNEAREYSRSSQRDVLGNLLKDLGKNVKLKEDALKEVNERLGRPREYPVFDRPELVRAPGVEVTREVRANFEKLIKEADKYCALPGLEGERIPKKQIEALREMVFKNRIFLSCSIDHDRSRVEFDVKKNEIIETWERNYHKKWPTYATDVFNGDKIMARKGKKVSRHHFLPVRAILIPEGSELEKRIQNGEINLAAPQFLKHYQPNEYQNMIPSVYPKDHLGGLHHSSSVFASIFGPIKLDYQYQQIDPDNENRFTYAVPKRFQHIAIPTFAKQFGYFLEKLEERIGYTLPVEQKEKVVAFVNNYVKSYHDQYKLIELDYSAIPGNVKQVNKLAERYLKSEWEMNTGMDWPRNARVEFLIPPFYKPENYEWWMIAPGRKSDGWHQQQSDSEADWKQKLTLWDKGDFSILHKVSQPSVTRKNAAYSKTIEQGGKLIYLSKPKTGE